MSYVYKKCTVQDIIYSAQTHDRYRQLGEYWGCKALLEYLEELADDSCTPIELDIIALCCEWGHYDSAAEAVRELISDPPEDDDPDALLELLRYNTTVLELDNGTILVQSF